MIGSANISDCGRFRYTLRRLWDDALPTLVVCMLNPSTADHEKNDPTILALLHFAKAWGYGGLLVVNLYAFRASRPSAMMMTDDRIGPLNGKFLNAALIEASANGNKLLIAWGTHGDFEGRAAWFINRASGHFHLKPTHLGRTKEGAPKHPMARGKSRIDRSQKPQNWFVDL